MAWGVIHKEECVVINTGPVLTLRIATECTLMATACPAIA